MKAAGEPVAVVDDRRPERETVPPTPRAAAGGALRPDVAPAPAGNLRDFLAELLAEQGRLDTPAARASHAYDQSSSAQRLGQTENRKAKIFESLVPLSVPHAGEQYAFEVDLDACTGCKACVSACHALNGLDANETWRDTGQLLGCASAASVVQTITTACHHCEDPGCLNGCPVLAYEKDSLTGIVRHLDDQCIGCQYCVLKCPYDVPKYNARLGIVRKCDLCHQRLAHGEAPACAQACPTQAIRVVVVAASASVVAPASSRPESEATPRWAPLSPAAPKNSHSGPHASKIPVLAEDSDDHPAAEIVNDSAAVHSAIGNPKSAISFPGPDPAYTRPTTRYVTARDFSADMRAADAHALRPQHTHWPLVLMLTLLPGAIVLQALLLTPLAAGRPGFLALAPLVLGALGLTAATFHLGQPLRAWRVFLGLRKSWFSREAVLFGAWFGATALVALAPSARPLAPAAAVTGLVGLACSVMIYVDTRRRFWRAAFTAPRFLLGGAVLALAPLAPFAAAAALVLKLTVEAASLGGDAPSARLQRGPLVAVLIARLASAAVGLAALAWSPWLALAPLLAGEIAERVLFFRAVDAPKMPGYAAP